MTSYTDSEAMMRYMEAMEKIGSTAMTETIPSTAMAAMMK